MDLRQEELPQGFVLDQPTVEMAPELPQGFVLDQPAAVPAAPKEDPGVLGALGNAVVRGKNNYLDQPLNIGGYLTGVLSPQETARAILADRAEAAAAPMTRGSQQFMDRVGQAGSFGEVWDEVKKAPLAAGGAAVQTGVEALTGLPAQIAGAGAGALGGGAIGGPGGAVVGGAAGFGAVSGATEFASTVVDALTNTGVEPTEENVTALLSDPEFMDGVKTMAARGGLIVGGVDALTASIAGRLFAPVRRMAAPVIGKTLSGVAGATAETGAQAAGGAGGEALKQLERDGSITAPADVAMEAAAEVVGAGAEVPATIKAIRSGEGLAVPKSAPLPAGFVLDTAPSADNAQTDPTNATAPVQPAPTESEAGTQAAPAAPVQAQPDPNAQVQTAAPVEPQVQQPGPAPQPGPALQPVRSEKVTTPDGSQEFDTDFEVVEADRLKAAEGDLQPRDRANRIGSDMQVQNMAARLDPLRLTSSRESDRGAPIIDDQDTILSGNGRTAAILAAMKNNPDRYDAYKAELTRQGFNIEGMKAPVLVRRAKGLSPDIKRTFAVRSNSDGGLGLSPTERAGIEKDYVSQDMLSGFDADTDLGVSAASNRPFVRAFLNSVPPNEQASFVNKAGELTPAGARRMTGALFAAAYGDKTLIERMVEDEADPSLRNALTGAAGAWANMRKALGEKNPLDITKDLIGAVDLLNKAKAAGMTLKNFQAQQDAFDTTSPRAAEIAKLFFNKSGNRMAAWRDIKTRLTAYANAAERTTRASGDIFGEQQSADDIIASLVAGITGDGPQTPAPAAANQNADGELFTGSEVISKGPVKRAKVAKVGAPEGQGAMFDAPDQTRAPRGTMAPKTAEVSFTNRASYFEDAFRVAGIDPDRGQLLPPERKLRVLADVLAKTFGFRVNLKTDLSVPDAVNQMLDAYRNVRFMMHALALPVKAVSLNGTLSINLEKYRGHYLGMYDPANRAIHMPGRSNSFAHEWMHALDDYLGENVANAKDLLSRVTRSEGLDPADSLQASYINLIHKLFFNEADLALQMLRLETEAAKVIQKGPNAGQPTAAALKAQAQLERLATGATQIRVKPSAYRQNAANYHPPSAGYYASVHEMIARAFEAYTAMKVELAGGSNEFITKGDQNYLSDADRRLAMTFPKDADRLNIFSAFDDVFDHIRAAAILGTDPAAEKPVDTDLTDPAKWTSIAAFRDGQGLVHELKQEVHKLTNAVKNATSQPLKTTLKSSTSAVAVRAGIGATATSPKNLWRAVNDFFDWSAMMVRSGRGIAKMVVKRQNDEAKPFVQWVVNRLTTDPGTGREDQVATWEEAAGSRTNVQTSELQNALDQNGLGGRITKEVQMRLRDLMLGKDVKNATKGEVAVAATMRRLMDGAWQAANKAGIAVGYVRNQGYLPRIILREEVMNRLEEFTSKAREVYKAQFDHITKGIGSEDLLDFAAGVMAAYEPAVPNVTRKGQFAAEYKAVVDARKALSEAQNARPRVPADVAQARAALKDAMDELLAVLRDPYAETSADAWAHRIQAGDSFSYDSHGPNTSFAKTRTLVPEADTILGEAGFYDTDTIHSTVQYLHSVNRRTAYVERFGQTNGEKFLKNILRRSDIQDAMKSNPSKYNPDTAAGSFAMVRDLANPAEDDIKEMMLNEAVKWGGNGNDVQTLRGLIERITGRESVSPLMRPFDTLSTWVSIFTFVALLPRATLTAVTEPITMMMRTGSGKAAFRTLGMYVGEAVRGAKSTQERQALAECIGVVSTALHDTVLLNRLSGDHGHTVSGNVIMANFFRAIGLTQLTNAQRRAVMAGGFFWLRDLAQQHGKVDSTKKKIIEAEFRDLGVDAAHFEAIKDWLTQSDTLPSPTEMQSTAGQVMALALLRFTDQTIQNPHRMDKALSATTPIGRMSFGLMSFFYTFFRNVHQASFLRMSRNYGIARGEGLDRGTAVWQASAPALATLGGGFAMMFAGQFLVTMLREAIYNPEQWEKHKDDDDLEEWLLRLAFSRTGVTGPADPLLNALTGLRYERDVVNLATGPGLSYLFSNLQNMLKVYTGPNSKNTNSTERTAAKSLYRMAIAPAASWALSAIPVGGPVTWAGRYALMGAATSNAASAKFADAVAGEKK